MSDQVFFGASLPDSYCEIFLQVLVPVLLLLFESNRKLEVSRDRKSRVDPSKVLLKFQFYFFPKKKEVHLF